MDGKKTFWHWIRINFKKKDLATWLLLILISQRSRSETFAARRVQSAEVRPIARTSTQIAALYNAVTTGISSRGGFEAGPARCLLSDGSCGLSVSKWELCRLIVKVCPASSFGFSTSRSSVPSWFTLHALTFNFQNPYTN